MRKSRKHTATQGEGGEEGGFAGRESILSAGRGSDVYPWATAGPLSRMETLTARFHATRRRSVDLVAPLSPEDAQVQSMPDASPAKWHLAHTTWFFSTFLLGQEQPPGRPGWEVLYNSYYQTVGPQYPRPRRGLLTRPSLAEVLAWRREVDGAVDALLAADPHPDLLRVLEVGIQHEQQHQELLLTDILHAFSCNPLEPVYEPAAPASAPATDSGPPRWLEHAGGLVEVGHAGGGFAFDNEGPRHQVHLQPFALASRLLSCGEVLDFMADGGYLDPTLWMADGWAWVQAEGIRAPLHWREGEDGWQHFTLRGPQPVRREEPAAHLSWYEADALARWAGARLPTEEEWEAVAADPALAPGLEQLDDQLWQWTGSAYRPYPGYHPPPGAIGEYNGKFMSNQFVLRGGSCATPPGHTRTTYRNFFYPWQRWQFTGLRLARDP